ncbi:MAG: GNAT family N-acetyltransferase [Gammaproteobacteria bacterium]|nr:GNAT family N-acetyltransferase [Gammaproteobacteria bacterium]MDH4312485.1 GNAT family N-acetyltransferase [Gammaproteobacteria bacterium]MDH5272760.1 GNAT family N-acetyltransferase [Gammaproteobacteria bacterium]
MTASEAFRIEPAQPADAALIVALVRELAAYERLLDDVRLTPQDLHRDLFGPRAFAEAVVARVGDEPVGFALWFHNYSTFEGRPGLYLEDLFVRPAFRGCGYGEALLRHLARVAVERGCARFEWSVLDWNEPALAFYRKLGAVPMDEWTVQRVSGVALHALAAGDEPGGFSR